MDNPPDQGIQDLIDKGIQLHQAGEFPRAETVYRQVLAIDPDHADANQLLGTIAYQTGNHDAAVQLISKAIRKTPGVANYHSNLGNAFKGLGRLDDAADSYRNAVLLNPDLAVAHNNLGNTLQELGQPDKAVASFQKALQIEPGYAEAHSNLADTFREMGRLDDAVASCRKALAIEPNYAEALGNLGAALHGLKRLDEALGSYRKALAINPGLAKLENNLGCVLFDLGKPEEAVASYDKALGLKPDYAETYSNLGNAFKELGKLDDAVASYRKALAIKPEFTEAGRNLLYSLLNVPGLSPQDLFAEHLRFSDNHARHIRPVEDLPNDPTPDRRLRVGYLSSDFRNHPVGLNMLPLVSSHDRAEFEVFCYADVPKPDAVTERFRSCADHWRAITGKPDSEVAGMVRQDAIDVLVSMAGHFDSNRPLVCAHRAAPVQVSFHDGATSGLEEMDYWLTDDFLNPPDTREMFTEELYRLPVFYQYLPLEESPTVEVPPAGQAGEITFGSFNNPGKVNDEVIGLWAKVLVSVPGSRLLLKYKNLYAQVSLQDSVIERFAACGVASDRILFSVSPDTFTQHLGRYAEVDIALDPFPFNGATTTFQALWMGVPVVSLAGQTFVSRAAGSMLHHVGLGDMAVDTPEAYVACARDLAGDRARLRTLRETLRERVATSPLCDAPAYARSIEGAFRDMWRTWCAARKHPVT
jgi:predicted O-linked N-acetylglucosamine transferase (SPINDLY family)